MHTMHINAVSIESARIFDGSGVLSNVSLIQLCSNECKRRKIKCNGNTPCQRCGNLKLECQYAPNCCANGFKDSEEFKQMSAQIVNLQAQVNNLYNDLNALRTGDSTVAVESRPVERSLSI